MIHFTVSGIPQPQGSFRSFIPKGWTRAIVTSANPRLKQWRASVRSAAVMAMQGGEPAGRNMPIRLTLNFYFRQAKSNKKMDMTIRPDCDKLIRAICDSLTGVAYTDDSQVVEIHAFKGWRARAGVAISVEESGYEAALARHQPISDEALPF